ncbi:MAG TPA: metallopeptidase family protein [Kofleriaceae bacterium]|nr:metallopeptidase family protein [Kofleriaceae bacterium]
MSSRSVFIALGLAALAGCGSGGDGKGRKQDDAGPGLRGAGRLGPLPQSGAGAHEGGEDKDHREAVICPLDSEDPDAVLDETGRLLYDVGDYEKALACAELSVDLVPQAVEAHHYRAAALAALGRYGDAQVAFAMALARDPDDPETLAAAADFYINIALPKQRSSVQLGLEYARRGSGRAASRRRLDRRLRARLFLLEAEALNDLGQSDLALGKVEAALKLSPRMAAALHERGVTLFSLCRFRAAEEAFLAVLREHPDDPYAHHHLGLIYERDNREADAEAHFARARTLAPDDFAAPVMLTPEEFRAEVDEAIAELAPDVRADLARVSLELADLPALDDLVAVEPPFAPTIMGLYRGLPLGVEEGVAAAASPSAGAATASSAALDVDGNPAVASPAHATAARPGDRVPARAIVLYRKNLGRAVRSREELDRQIRRTLIHEIGHLRGLDEDDLRRRGLE